MSNFLYKNALKWFWLISSKMELFFIMAIKLSKF